MNKKKDFSIKEFLKLQHCNRIKEILISKSSVWILVKNRNIKLKQFNPVTDKIFNELDIFLTNKYNIEKSEDFKKCDYNKGRIIIAQQNIKIRKLDLKLMKEIKKLENNKDFQGVETLLKKKYPYIKEF